MSSLLQDLKYAVRGFVRTPGVTLLAIATLAVGVGANAAIFSVIHTVMLEPLPYPHADRIVIPWRTSASMGGVMLSPSRTDIETWTATPVFEAATTYSRRSLVLTDGAEPEDVRVVRVDTRFLDFTGAQPRLGRPFTRDDAGSEAAAHVLLLTDSLWKRRYGGDPGIVGRRIELSDTSYEVIGVLPASFRVPLGPVDALAPLPSDKAEAAATTVLSALARLAPDTSIAAAEEALTAAGVQGIGRATDWRVKLMRPADMTGTTFKRALLVLFGAVGFVLLIACANVANLVLARNASRDREIAVRIAIGAGRVRLVRQLLTENVLLAGTGGGAGVALGVVGLQSIAALRPPDMRELESLRLSWEMLAFGFVVATFTGVIFGVYPALAGSRQDAAEALRQGTRIAGDARRRIVRQVLSVAEVALALILLAGAGLLIRSYARMQNADLGFATERLLAVHASLPEARYPTPEARAEFLRQLAANIEQLPGVRQAMPASGLPPQGGLLFGQIEIEGAEASGQPSAPMGGGWVGPGYFAAMRIPIRAGREFTATDATSDTRVALVNETMARRYWSGESPIGKRFRVSAKGPWTTVIGVAGDVKMSHGDAGGIQVYYPIRDTDVFPDTPVLVATAGDPALLIGGIKGVIWNLDSKLPLKRIATMEEKVAETLARPRFNLVLLSIFAGVGLLLAAIGIYGVVSHSVSTRTREIGVRMALGANPSHIRWAVLRESLLLAVLGTGIGVAGALALGRFMKTLVYEVSASDPLTLGIVAAVLTGTALIAAWVPARRAMRTDPMIALRAD